MPKPLGSVFRPALVLSGLFLVVGFAGVAFQAIRTLQRLTIVEAERDQWQRPSDVIRALDLKHGSVVVDFGSGAGYFTLKLSNVVANTGEVVAVDLRSLSLLFLRIRALVQRKHNIRMIIGDPDNPHLSAAAVDAVLISNTYHELSNPESILRHLSRALRPGGRLVIVDPGPTHADSLENPEHSSAPETVEADLRREGFEILNRDASFIKGPREESWWLIVAAKP
jgi:ubiquinone/menaquinone biosynthesis C-methylase UbiE